MDTFFEQIVTMKMTAGKKALCGLLIFCAVLLTVILFLLLTNFAAFAFIIILAAVGVWYGLYKLIGNFKIEYEYILTNGDLDVDMIINKSRRKRLITFKCSDVEKITHYEALPAGDKKVYVCCGEGDGVYGFTVRHKKEGVVTVVLAPDERMQGAISKYIPRIILKDAFK